MYKKFLCASAILATVTLLTSCGGPKSLIVPTAVSSANAISAGELNLNKGDYDILNTVSETTSITVKYSRRRIQITSGDGDFAYTFKLSKATGWYLATFRGTANFGYILQDASQDIKLPNAEEFARRVAIARVIESVKDFGADGVLEPVITTRASNVSHNTVEYQATATAKIVKIHPTN